MDLVGSHLAALPEFAVAIESFDDRVSVTLSGHGDDVAAKILDAALHDVVRDGRQRNVELELGDLTELDPRVLGVILGTRANLDRQGRTLHVVAVSAEAAHLLEQMGVDRVLDLRDEPDA